MQTTNLTLPKVSAFNRHSLRSQANALPLSPHRLPSARKAPYRHENPTSQAECIQTQLWLGIRGLSACPSNWCHLLAALLSPQPLASRLILSLIKGSRYQLEPRSQNAKKQQPQGSICNFLCIERGVFDL